MKTLLATAFFAVVASAADLPVEFQAKFVKILATSTGAAGVDVSDPAMITALAKEGLKPEAASKVAYAASEAEVKKYKGKLVICPNPDWLKAGASIAIVAEGGKPAILLHVENANASGVRLPDAIIKSSRKV